MFGFFINIGLGEVAKTDRGKMGAHPESKEELRPQATYSASAASASVDAVSATEPFSILDLHVGAVYDVLDSKGCWCEGQVW